MSELTFLLQQSSLGMRMLDINGPTFGDGFIPSTLILDSGVTRPPPLLSEADLLSCMDKEGIGTDATMHDHIKKLLDRFYATKDANTRFTPTNLGEALVMGYDDMGYKLWKPYLRAVMERDMKFVSEGNKSKADVLATSLQLMEACFLDARLNKGKLLEAMAIFFERYFSSFIHMDSLCKMLIGIFNRYCRSSRSGNDELHAMGVVRRCGLCQESDMVLRKNRCRNAVWLPGSLSEAVVTTNTCNICTPGCIGGCDEILSQMTEICGRGSRMPARPRGPTAPPSNAHHTNPRQRPCVNCQETGHSSNDCPLRSGNVGHRGRSEHNGNVSVDFKILFQWEDSLNDGTGGRSASRSNSIPSSNPRRAGGRGYGGRGGQTGAHAAATTFVSATGDPISGRRCFRCGDPSHFANVCPNRGV
ncbi:hypothetical protein V8G54_007146 [Vigna mungo]|uniref:DNA topoisomerase n=1 Tax=Vigna mungo TaxID=3915 RepID=A0AAQ3S571_VIGMU